MIDFKALYNISYGLYIISSGNRQKGNGFVANAFFQVTAEPPRFAVCCNKDNYSANLIKTTGAYAVSVLHQKASMELIGTFGYKSGEDIDKFKDTDFYYGSTGVPIVKSDSMAVLECKLVEILEVGTHYIFIGELLHAQSIGSDTEPLTYSYYRNEMKGFAPKNAPTFIDKSKLDKTETSENTSPQSYSKYKCKVCGFLYEEKPGALFEDLPDNWKCPVCGVGKKDFSIL